MINLVNLLVQLDHITIQQQLVLNVNLHVIPVMVPTPLIVQAVQDIMFYNQDLVVLNVILAILIKQLLLITILYVLNVVLHVVIAQHQKMHAQVAIRILIC